MPASSTALLIAHSTAFLADEPEVGFLVPQRAVALSRRFIDQGSAFNRLLLRVADGPAGRAIIGCCERVTIPGLMLHYALRKRCIEDHVRGQIARGCRQVVVLGAGFDTLALRLAASYPATWFIEMDLQATQAAKLRALVGASRPANITFLPIDLADDDVTAVLRACPRYDDRQDTTYVMEGLLMYLPMRKVDDLFDSLHPCRRRSRCALIFTFMERRRSGRIRFDSQSYLADLWLRLRSEPFRSSLDRCELAGLAARAGCHIVDLAEAAALSARYLPACVVGSRPHAAGEVLCVAANAQECRDGTTDRP